jgi:hypothetical protein
MEGGMRLRFWAATALAALALMAPRVHAEPVELGSDYDQSEAPATGDSVAAAYAEPSEVPPAPDAMVADAPATPEADQCTCGNCNQCCRRSKCGPYSERCPRIGAVLFSGIDSFRGITNGSTAGNYGAVNGLNLGGALVEDYGIGWQFGGSYGVYNFSGNPSAFSNTANSTLQGFITTGLFQRANTNRRWSWGLVHDWMITNNFGAFGNSPTLSQWRGQLAWALSAKNEVGMWATVQDRSVTRTTAVPPGVGAFAPITYQAIDQGNLFWHHKFATNGADSWSYIGIPLDKRLATPANSAGFPIGGSGGSLGSFIVGTNLLIPINDRLSGYANMMYMRPSAAEGVSPTGASAAAQQFWNVSFGMAFYPGRAARSQTVAGREWMPYLPVANNSSFLVDASKTH